MATHYDTPISSKHLDIHDYVERDEPVVGIPAAAPDFRYSTNAGHEDEIQLKHDLDTEKENKRSNRLSAQQRLLITNKTRAVRIMREGQEVPLVYDIGPGRWAYANGGIQTPRGFIPVPEFRERKRGHGIDLHTYDLAKKTPVVGHEIAARLGDPKPTPHYLIEDYVEVDDDGTIRLHPTDKPPLVGHNLPYPTSSYTLSYPSIDMPTPNKAGGMDILVYLPSDKRKYRNAQYVLMGIKLSRSAPQVLPVIPQVVRPKENPADIYRKARTPKRNNLADTLNGVEPRVDLRPVVVKPPPRDTTGEVPTKAARPGTRKGQAQLKQERDVIRQDILTTADVRKDIASNARLTAVARKQELVRALLADRSHPTTRLK